MPKRKSADSKPANSTRKHAITFDHSLGRTKQSFLHECNINNIMAKFQRTGQINHYAKYAPQYGEITGADLMDAMQTIIDADNMFEELPSTLRDRFNNDPAQFLEFIENPENREEMRKYDLVSGRHSDTSHPIFSRRLEDQEPQGSNSQNAETSE